jgi:DNA-binding winged helix-turn-helix (wHTH) protein
VVDPEPIPDSISGSRLVEVLVLGRIQVSGWLHRPRRKVGLALLCYLALHPSHPVSGAQLLDALWPIDSNRKEANRASLHSYMSDLRGALGEGVLPDAGTTDGYLLSGAVATDWGTFTALTAEADDAEPAEAARLRSKALSLIRGAPFEGSVGDRFEWAAAEHHIAAMEVAITECAHRLSAWCLESGDPASASEAARIGLLGVPDAWLSHADLIRAVQAGGDPAALRRAWKAVRRRLGDGAVTRLSKELGTDPPHGIT